MTEQYMEIHLIFLCFSLLGLPSFTSRNLVRIIVMKFDYFQEASSHVYKYSQILSARNVMRAFQLTLNLEGGPGPLK